MTALHYLAEIDRLRALRTYIPITRDLTKDQLEFILLMVINGVDLEYAFDCIMGTKK